MCNMMGYVMTDSVAQKIKLFSISQPNKLKNNIGALSSSVSLCVLLLLLDCHPNVLFIYLFLGHFTPSGVSAMPGRAR